ncbi:MAG: DUF2797 domain-containing protein, partial [Pseudomonadales bacterium]|nr:DUF2797 domain-containing protein [Pseudomonadales bacterium]
QQVAIHWSGSIFCIHCQRKTTKSFNQGYCYPCFKRLASCDTCIMSPEKCHFDQGTCREPAWAEKHCMVDHIVYFSNTSGPKIGITRNTQVPVRWIDQGATQAVPVLRVPTRKHSGLIEAAMKQHLADKTNWRALLKGDAEQLDMEALREGFRQQIDQAVGSLPVDQQQDVQWLEQKEQHFVYPVEQYPAKIASFNLDKNPEASGRLLGVKGQYMILDNGVINIRKYTAYELAFSVASA